MASFCIWATTTIHTLYLNITSYSTYLNTLQYWIITPPNIILHRKPKHNANQMIDFNVYQQQLYCLKCPMTYARLTKIWGAFTPLFPSLLHHDYWECHGSYITHTYTNINTHTHALPTVNKTNISIQVRTLIAKMLPATQFFTYELKKIRIQSKLVTDKFIRW